MNELVTTAGLQVVSQAAKHLINKLSSAVGWTASQKTDEELAREIYIEDIKKSNLPSLQKAAFVSNATKIIKEYTNQHNIVKYAIENMEQSAHPEEIQDDWLFTFMDKARLISDEEFQLIWGYILAKECMEPNSIPKSLLSTLEKMDKIDAETFSALCKFSPYIVEDNKKTFTTIIVYSKIDEFYSKFGITFETLSDLQSLGLIQFNPQGSVFSPDVTAYVCNSPQSPIVLHYFDEIFTFPNDIYEVPLGNVLYTKSGHALCKAIKAEKDKDFFKAYCIPLCEKHIIDTRAMNKKGNV